MVKWASMATHFVHLQQFNTPGAQLLLEMTRILYYWRAALAIFVCVAFRNN